VAEYPDAPSVVIWPGQVVVGFRNLDYIGGLTCEGGIDPGEVEITTTTTTRPFTPDVTITSPSHLQTLHQNQAAGLSAGLSSAAHGGTFSWTLRYPTSVDGRDLDANGNPVIGLPKPSDLTETYLIGEGPDLSWVPQNTPGLEFAGGIDTCELIEGYGVIRVEVASLVGGTLSDEIVVGFRNPTYIGGVTCGLGSTTTSSATTTTSTIPVTVTTKPLIPPVP
jgi:hypothetical protein